ncbi:chemotaxis response regulator protein-glutamate methylesterase [candidate division GN15 bacterium]|uniref:Protein-glutamate methylesterase/protein-glutamine glutaminase n=1 Tax=candidate division GN15 bacterium TaxID=2072418 RepID=A0A855WYU1_9BACT|nr:MAG: chemotaxis response regulator protein-glutamate methylesterase [candidate division GN15 bacterium]
MTKVLVVDDSAFMRKAISIMLESDPQIKVIGQARDGEEAIEKVRILRPDLVTMDVEMPRMDGLAALQQIMKSDPTPVMMISSITTEGAEATLEALELGAIDFIPKQMSYVSLDIVKIKDELLAKIKDIARRKHLLMAQYRHRQFARARGKTGGTATGAPVATAPSIPATPVIRRRNHAIGIVAVGSSTGGPPALSTVLSRLPGRLPVGIVIAQHMPAQFTKSLAERLDSICQLSVREAADGDKILPGQVLIAPGGQNMTVRRRGGDAIVCVSSEPASTLYKPCVDVLMNSVADYFSEATLGVMLTGMGNNGIHGIRNVKGKGGVVVAQNEQTCVVYGMPRAVIEAGLADHIAAIDDIPAEITSYF